MSEVWSAQVAREEQAALWAVVDRLQDEKAAAWAFEFVKEALSNYDSVCFEGGYSSLIGLDNLIQCVDDKVAEQCFR